MLLQAAHHGEQRGRVEGRQVGGEVLAEVLEQEGHLVPLPAADQALSRHAKLQQLQCAIGHLVHLKSRQMETEREEQKRGQRETGKEDKTETGR